MKKYKISSICLGAATEREISSLAEWEDYLRLMMWTHGIDDCLADDPNDDPDGILYSNLTLTTNAMKIRYPGKYQIVIDKGFLTLEFDSSEERTLFLLRYS